VKRIVVAAVAAFALAAGTARADDGPVLGFTAAASPAAAAVSLPASDAPNNPGSISIPTDFTTAPATPQQLPLPALQALWQRAGNAYGVPWQVLAAINKIESNFGQNMGPSSAGAIGWMQFMPDTWLRWGVDADGDGIANPWVAADAIYAAARYLAAAGGRSDISRAVFAYNHADWYVNEVLQLAQVYGAGGATETADLQQLQDTLVAARRDVSAANRVLVRALQRETAMQHVASVLQAKIDAARILSDRLNAERNATLYGARLSTAADATDRAREALTSAVSRLHDAQAQASAPSFAPGASSLLAAPSYANGYAFPVGGGPSIVSVAHTHHDYPAADIAAPEGSPVFALTNALVLNAWQTPDARCGIGMTIQADDGQVWTYCHLSYLAPTVADGVRLVAGQQVGLVGHTGHATGPHLHLQLQPATMYPQLEAWFQGFAGRAFRWQDAPTPEVSDGVASAPVFAVVGEDSAPAQADPTPVITFTR
jgi:murein DD-endopeptidase MepM/ murein hydrolase activator NlpD